MGHGARVSGNSNQAPNISHFIAEAMSIDLLFFKCKHQRSRRICLDSGKFVSTVVVVSIIIVRFAVPTICSTFCQIQNRISQEKNGGLPGRRTGEESNGRKICRRRTNFVVDREEPLHHARTAILRRLKFDSTSFQIALYGIQFDF